MKFALTVSLLFAFVFASSIEAREPPQIRPSPYSETTIVVCNGASEGSEALARYYVKSRGIPEDHIVVLQCPASEEVTRAEFAEQIEKPLRDEMLSRGWWMPERDPETGEQAVRSSVQIVALIHGVPVKVRDDRAASEADREDQKLQNTGASVDSELTILGEPSATRGGPLKNPYFKSEQAFHEAALPILLVGRIDGPSIEDGYRMIDDAIQTEIAGLWGQAYIDLDDRHEMGNTWLLGAADEFRKLGIPVTTNHFAETFPTGYPLRDPILYFGWYEQNVSGPFADADFRFKPGAVACHLHSFSAVRLRSGSEFWAGPLLSRGAAAVLGNVYEPYLQFTHQFDTFANRLTSGYTFIESAYASIEAISWMGIAVGDPLYQPFPAPNTAIDESRFAMDEAAPYKALRLAYERWGAGKPLAEGDLFFKLELASTKMARAELIEHLGLNALEIQNYEEARTQFLRARAKYEDKRDKLRMELQIVELERRFDDRLAAFKALRSAIQAYGDIPEVVAAEELLKALQTPAPSTNE